MRICIRYARTRGSVPSGGPYGVSKVCVFWQDHTFIVKFTNRDCLIVLEPSSEDGLNPEDVVVNESDFKAAMKKFIPSISSADMEYFNRLRSNFSA